MSSVVAFEKAGSTFPLMATLIGITGTGTGIGKTALSAATLLYGLQAGKRVAYCKAVQCGLSPLPSGRKTGGDADLLALKIPGPVTYAVPTCLQMPASPHLAAEAEGKRLSVSELTQAIADLAAHHDWVVIEGAGGAAVPFTRQGFCLPQLALPIQWLVAAAPGLGTLHHTRTTVAWLQHVQAKIAGIVFCETQTERGSNDIAPLAEIESMKICEDNKRTLEDLTDTPCLGTLPYLESWLDNKPLSPAECRLWLTAIMPGFKKMKGLV